MYCTNCGSHNPDTAKYCFSCGHELIAEVPPVTAIPEPAAPSPAPAAPPSPPPIEYAGFWRRVLALMIDQLILSIPFSALALMFILPAISAIIQTGDSDMMASVILSSIISWIWLGILLSTLQLLYFALFECSRFQATPGKMAIGIIVTDSQGRRISFPRSIGRNLGKILSKMILWIGYIMAGLTARKQALHDMLADCLVVMR